MGMKLSIVIPVFNEQDSLPALCDEIEETARQNELDFETIFVDDGSSDRSWAAIEQLSRRHPAVQGLQFRRNFGKSAALAAGIRHATTDWIVTIDADLQDNIGELPKLIARANEGLDLVNGWKVVRQDPLGRRMASKVFNWLVNRISGLGLHDHNCGFKLLRRQILDDLPLYGDWHRFIPVLAASRGWRVGEVEVDHRRRQFGKSKYGLSRFVHGTLDLITIAFLTSHNHRPQRFLGTLGLFSGLLGFLGMLYLAIYWVLRMTLYDHWPPVHERPLLVYSLGALLVGAHLLALGFLAELIVARQGERGLMYSISRTTRDGGKPNSVPDNSTRREPSFANDALRVDRPTQSRPPQRT
jgi:dolichol-phosphate mannosyltransferase